METTEQIDELISDSTKVSDKWGVVAEPGYLVLPFVLLANQARLGLTSELMNVLVNVLAHWHHARRMPFPHSSTIAKRMGVSTRTVQRALATLKRDGFLDKVRKSNKNDPQAYDVRPLLAKLKPLALERARLTGEPEFEKLFEHPSYEPVSTMFGKVTNYNPLGAEADKDTAF